jgi:hypothetical protein
VLSAVFMSDCLSTDPVEGAQTLALGLLEDLGSDATVLCGIDEPRAPTWRPVLSRRRIPWRALWELRRLRPAHVVWLPNGGLTYAAVLRLVLVHLVIPRAELRVVLVQRYRTPPAWLLRTVRGSVTAVATNARDERAFAAMGLRAELLEVEASTDRLCTLDVRSARRLLDLPSDRLVFLHVGHATDGRNLRSLSPLAASDVLQLVLSPYSPLDEGTLPTGPGVRVVHEKVSVGEYYRAADVYVFPTVDTNAAIGVPMSIVEALGNQLPVVARRSQLTERWDGHPQVTLVESDHELVLAARRVALRSGR